MANASAKRQAQKNSVLLTQLNRVSALIYAAGFLFWYVAGRRYILELILSVPGLFAQYLLNAWCSPKYDERHQLINPGSDIDQPGLIDYVKDVVYLTWGCVLLSVAVGTKVWLLLLLIPMFAGYKAFQLLKAGKQLFTGGNGAPQEPAQAPAAPAEQKKKIKRRYV